MSKKSKVTKGISILLVLCMLFTILPWMALATSDEDVYSKAAEMTVPEEAGLAYDLGVALMAALAGTPSDNNISVLDYSAGHDDTLPEVIQTGANTDTSPYASANLTDTDIDTNATDTERLCPIEVLNTAAYAIAYTSVPEGHVAVAGTGIGNEITSWEELRAAVNEAHYGFAEIYLVNSFQASAGAAGNAIVIPAHTQIYIKNASNNMITLIQDNAEQRHFIVEGYLNLEGNITLSGNGANLLGGPIRGGIHVMPSGRLSLYDGVVISGNRAAYGGGVYLGLSAGLDMYRSHIRENAVNQNGGGVFAVGSDGIIRLCHSQINNNTAVNGGGIFMLGQSSVDIYNHSQINNNTATGSGGGVHMVGRDSGVSVHYRSQINGNTAGGSGGGVHIADIGSVGLYFHSQINNNTAGGSGGGVFITGGGYSYVQVYHSQISGNTAGGNGGGVHVSGSGRESGVGADHGIISNNTATGSGGGIYIYGYDSEAELLNSQISDNTAINGNGGGISGRRSGIELTGTVVENNEALNGNGGGIFLDGSENRRADEGYVSMGPDYFTSEPSAVRGNQAGVNGGGVWVYRSYFSMCGDSSRVENNTAGSNGGGVWISGLDATFHISEGVISGNTAGNNGGGIFASIRYSEALGEIEKGIIRNNTARNDGGGIFWDPVQGWQNLYVGYRYNNASIYNNHAGTVRVNDQLHQEYGYRIRSSVLTPGLNHVFNNRDISTPLGHTPRPVRVSTWEELRAAVNEAHYGFAEIYLANSFQAPTGVAGNAIVILEGRLIYIKNASDNMITLTQGNTGQRHFIVEGRSTLNLEGNITLSGDGANLPGGPIRGGIHVMSNGRLSLYNGVVISGNRAIYGGGVYLGLLQEGLHMYRSHIRDNAANQNGGGVFAAGSTIMSLCHSQINNNTAVNGGGVFMAGRESDVDVDNHSRINNNTATGSGGGVHIADIGSVALSFHSQINNNTAGGSGGGVFITGGGYSGVSVYHSQISGNIAGGNGGGVHVSGSGRESGVSADHGIISNNTATGSGGGIYIYGYNSEAELRNSQISGNTAINGNGGGISGRRSGIDLLGTVVENNRALNGNGGGIFVDGSENRWADESYVSMSPDYFTSESSAVRGNQAINGGGVWVYRSDFSMCEDSSRVENNTATNNGGGVWISGLGATFHICEGVISDNTAGNNGGGVFASISYPEALGEIEIEKGIIRNNTAGNDGGGIFFWDPVQGWQNLYVGHRYNNARVYNNHAGTVRVNDQLHQEYGYRIRSSVLTSGFNHVFNNRDIGIPLGSEYDVSVSTWAEFRAAVAAVPAQGTRVIGISQNFQSPTGSAGNAIAIPANRHITLVSTSSETRTLTQGVNGQRHFTIAGGASLTLGDSISLSGGNTNSGGVQVNAGGTLTMNERSVIENIRRTVVGGAVALSGSGSAENNRATLNLNGGVIQNNTATNGGGVHLGTNSVVNMSGGSIANNVSTSTASGAGGGGVFLNAATSVFNMSGGTINGNRSASGTRTNAGGGGVRISNGIFNMTNQSARIENNAASGTSASSGGGGIFQSGGTVRISAGTIANNTAVNQGGGVRVSATAIGAFSMTGGTISNNSATRGDGGGIFTTQGSNALTVPETAYRNLNVGAAVSFSDNTSGLGASAPPNNRLAHIALASVSIWDYALNNHDINYAGRLGQIQWSGGPVVNTWEALRAEITGTPANTPITIHISANFQSPTGSAGNAIAIPANRHITLVSTSSETRTLTQGVNGQRHFTIAGGASLTLGDNISLSGGNTNSGGVQVNAGGALTMNERSVIENIRRTVVGGAVALSGSGSAESNRATLNLNGGVIQNNTATNGGGVHLGTNSVVNMSGGSIANNISTSTASGAGGGGVFLNAATSVFNMSGGTINGNRSASGTRTNAGGGGVRISNGIFNMTNQSARIENNAASGTSASSGGGGIFQSGGTVRISAGTITNNTAVNQGGGVRVSATTVGAFTMSGGTISNNHAGADGGGIFSTQSNNALTLPVAAYRNLSISNVAFSHNSSSRGASAPPDNQLAHVSVTSSSIWDYALNNYDINYVGRLGQAPLVALLEYPIKDEEYERPDEDIVEDEIKDEDTAMGEVIDEGATEDEITDEDTVKGEANDEGTTEDEITAEDEVIN